jgi:prophage regulatory protein
MSNEAKPIQTRILRRHEVEARYGLKRSTIYDAVRAGTFPPPVRLGARAIGWVESEVEAWIASRIAASRPVVA